MNKNKIYNHQTDEETAPLVRSWAILNRLHKVFKPSSAWLMVADMVAILTLLVTIQRTSPKYQDVLHGLFEGVCGQGRPRSSSQGWVYGVPQNGLWRTSGLLKGFSLKLPLLITCTGLIILKYRPVDWLRVILGSVLPFVVVFI